MCWKSFIWWLLKTKWYHSRKVTHVLEVAAAMDRREAAFPGRMEKMKKNCCSRTFLFLLLLFLFFFVVVFWYMEGVDAISCMLCSAQEPREALIGSKWLPTTLGYPGHVWELEVKELPPLTQTWPAHLLWNDAWSGEHGIVSSNLMKDECEGNGGFISGAPGSGGVPAAVAAFEKAECHLHQENWGRVVGHSRLFVEEINQKYHLEYLNGCGNT